MKTPRVQSLLAALALLAASRVAASAAAAAEPETIRWRPVVFHSSNGKNAMPCGVAYCKASHCAKAPVGPTHVPLYCRDKNGAMENSSYVMTLTPSGSRFILTSNKGESGPTGISVKFGDQWATAPDPDKTPRHAEASKPRTKPGGKKPRVKPGTKPETKPEVKPEPKPELKPEPNPEVKPETKPEAVQDLKPLTDDEMKNLTEAERIAYKSRLDQARAKLEEGEKKADPALIAAANEELSAIIAQYREQAEKNKLPDVKDMKEFEALTPTQKNLFCDKLRRSSSGGAGGSRDEKALDQVKQAAKGTSEAEGTISGARSNMVATVPPPPDTKLPEGELKKLAEACDKFLAGKPSAGGSKVAQGDNVPAPPTKAKDDCEKKDKDGKCVEEKKADPNAWLSVKTGAVGMLPGVMVGSFFGPVGIVVGAVVGFALFWGLSKLS